MSQNHWLYSPCSTTISLVCFCLGCLSFWCHIHAIIANNNVIKIFLIFFPKSCIVSDLRFKSLLWDWLSLALEVLCSKKPLSPRQTGIVGHPRYEPSYHTRSQGTSISRQGKPHHGAQPAQSMTLVFQERWAFLHSLWGLSKLKRGGFQRSPVKCPASVTECIPKGDT